MYRDFFCIGCEQNIKETLSLIKTLSVIATFCASLGNFNEIALPFAFAPHRDTANIHLYLSACEIVHVYVLCIRKYVCLICDREGG